MAALNVSGLSKADESIDGVTVSNERWEVDRTVSFWIFPVREECSPMCWNRDGLKRIRMLDFCLSQCFCRDGQGQRSRTGKHE